MRATANLSPHEPIDVLVVSDIRLYRDGIRELLEGDERLRASGSAGSLPAVLAAVERARPRIALVDAATRGGPEAVRLIQLASPAASVILLTTPDDSHPPGPGIAGHVSRAASREDLLAAIDGAVADRTPATPADARLTARESEILRLLEQGLSNREIATRLCIGVPTVKSHVHNILRKLGAARRGQAAARARALV